MTLTDDKKLAARERPDFSRHANQAATAPAYFSVYDIHAYYGESYIVQGVTFNVHEGEILALLGRNGAGKTSTLRAIAQIGSPQLTQGEVWLDHQALHKMKAHEASQAGVGLVPEDRRIIQGLTVEENIQLAQIAPPVGWSLDRIYGLFPRLGERRKQEGTTLSGGEQQMLTIGRTLMGNPSFLLLDEPSEGIAPVIVKQMVSVIGQLKREGLTVLLSEQNLHFARPVADAAVIIEHGTAKFAGSIAQLDAQPDIRDAYLSV